MVRVDQLDVMRQVDVGCQDWALALFFQGQRDFITALQLEHHTLQVQQDIDHVFLNAVDG